MGRSPNIGELNLLRREADIIQKQNTVIPFPQGGKDKISPFSPRPKEGEISVTIGGKTQNMTPEGIMDSLMKGRKETEAEMLERMNRQNKESVARLKKKKEKDLGEKLKDYDGDPDAMAGGGLAGALAKLKKKYGKDIIQKGKAPKKSKKKETQDMFREFNRKNKADGGRANFSLGGLSKLLKMLSAKSPVQRYKDYLASVKKRSIEGDFKSLAPELGAISAGGILVNRKMKSILEEGNELQKEIFLKEYIEELNNDPSYDDRPELRDKLIEKYTESLFGERKAGGGLAYMLGEDDRTGFNKGGFNKGRRDFMKLMAGLASIPVIGKLFKPAAKVAKVVPLQNTTTEMPTWFPKFIDKVTYSGVGKKIDADIMKYETKDLPGIEVYKHDDGKIFVSGKNNYSKSYEIEYEPPGYEVIDYETGKAVKTKGNFTAQEEVPVNMDPDGNADFDAEVLESVDNILSSDARVMEEFATGKKIKKMKRGEFEVGRAESLADAARKGENLDDFATGGLAKLLGE